MQIPGLIEIDLSHNEIRSVESRALELKYLTRVQLANNDWSCDCFIKPLKTFLTSKIEYDQLLYKSGLFLFISSLFLNRGIRKKAKLRI